MHVPSKSVGFCLQVFAQMKWLVRCRRNSCVASLPSRNVFFLLSFISRKICLKFRSREREVLRECVVRGNSNGNGGGGGMWPARIEGDHEIAEEDETDHRRTAQGVRAACWPLCRDQILTKHCFYSLLLTSALCFALVLTAVPPRSVTILLVLLQVF